MEIIQCFNCGKSATDVAVFCPFCLAQLKCKHCKSTLIKDSIGCADCGTPLVERNIAEKNIINQIEFEQKGDHKKFKASFSNEVGHSLVETFGVSVVGGGIQLKKKPSPFTNPRIENKTPTGSSEAPIQEIEVEDEMISEELTKIFKKDGDALVLINPRLKQRNKLDNAIRLAILTLYAYEQMGKMEIERKILSTVLKASKLNMPVFSTWINKCDEILINGNKLQLSVPGRIIAVELLKEIADSSITKGIIEFTKSGSGSRKARGVKSGERESDEEGSAPVKRNGNKSNHSYSILSNLDLDPDGKQSFKEFFRAHGSEAEGS